jgi:hypothetical protein
MWLMLIHQLPPTPAYLRVKIRRRLRRLGAVPIKSTVYVLPAGEEAREDLEWLLREISEGGGDGLVCEAAFVAGLTDGDVEALFRADRDEEYARVSEEAKALLGEGSTDGLGKLVRLRARMEEIEQKDFFEAAGRSAARAALARVESALAGGDGARRSEGSGIEVRGARWVTRSDVGVDRMASAWLIRRFIDPEARFVFERAERIRQRPGELRFDTYEGEFTHESGCCTFEVLLARSGLSDAALEDIAQIVHDLDLRDGRYGRHEAAGVERVIEGIRAAQSTDEMRLQWAQGLFDSLYASFQRSSRRRRAGVAEAT